MAAAVLRLLDDPALAERLRAAGLDVARGYTWATAGPLWAAVYGAVAIDGGLQ